VKALVMIKMKRIATLKLILSTLCHNSKTIYSLTIKALVNDPDAH